MVPLARSEGGALSESLTAEVRPRRISDFGFPEQESRERHGRLRPFTDAEALIMPLAADVRINVSHPM